jgi:hypothetical protein
MPDIIILSTESNEILDYDFDAFEECISAFLDGVARMRWRELGLGLDTCYHFRGGNLREWLDRLKLFLQVWGVPRCTRMSIYPDDWQEYDPYEEIPIFLAGEPVTETEFFADPKSTWWRDGIRAEWVQRFFDESEEFRLGSIASLIGPFGPLDSSLGLARFLAEKLRRDQVEQLHAHFLQYFSDGYWRRLFHWAFYNEEIDDE